ncbi:hypothetical protein HMPREF1219_00178 [Corynebacterium pyruviciproducens ATCC BAA-1742]|uniref:Uncharacterized protein n=1 Tax=Corynebacterium pyruviciproducens ATCC BAA-1742 TaxID=1125779 RepID=S2Z2A6_9CORY|nr:hypothetical protein [Corynebacterium pyruviciproducens]EPD70883.1 hypothetical protein HMPREF1219_00178 [Corynebacterium pyruviciproducens ATCC BAA-1742]
MGILVEFFDRADALMAAIIAAGGTWLASRESRHTNLRATLDTTAAATIERLQDDITRLGQRVADLEAKVGSHDDYAAYAIAEMHRVEDWLEDQDMHWPPPPPMSFYAWLNEQDRHRSD